MICIYKYVEPAATIKINRIAFNKASRIRNGSNCVSDESHCFVRIILNDDCCIQIKMPNSWCAMNFHARDKFDLTNRKSE